MKQLCAALLALLTLGVGPFTVVVDPGHGGDDHGARGANGSLEKGVALANALEIARALRAAGIGVVLTRTKDVFVSLAERTDVANRANADLFLSVHANSAIDPSARGAETYFLSLQASDDEAQRVAMTENEVYNAPAAAPDSGDIVGAILGDLIRTDHLARSSALSTAIQRRLDALGTHRRGVKQAPFVVLMNVNMPAALVELGFLTNAGEEVRLRQRSHQRTLARAIAGAVSDYRDAHRDGAPKETPE